jgi:serine/threonine protein kinase
MHSWYQAIKPYCTLLNLKSHYEIGNLLGKGNFAKVYEATSINIFSGEGGSSPRGKANPPVKVALKTIEKKTLKKCKRNFVRESL